MCNIWESPCGGNERQQEGGIPMTEYVKAEEYSQQTNLPVDSEEDIEFSEELADEDDQEAQERAEAADERTTGYSEE
jgi:hypothetical protein